MNLAERIKAIQGSRTFLTFNNNLKTFTYNIMPGITCPGKTPWCSDPETGECYAMKGQFALQTSRVALMKRTWWTFNGDFVDRAIKAITSAGVVRIHSAGDFYSNDYIEAWGEIIKKAKTSRLFAYTRSWRVPHLRLALEKLDHAKNFTLWFSMDPSIEKEDPDWKRIAYVEGTKGAAKPNCSKQIKKDKNKTNCLECGHCFNPRSRRVTFKIH